jgi:UDP-glucose 4-epimerase
MKVLVTGGTTWFGQSIVRRIQMRGHDVICLDESPASWRLDLPRPVIVRQGSVADLAAVLEAVRVERPDVIVNREVRYGPDVERRLLDAAKTNILGLMNVIEAALTAGIGRVVYESSIGVYGTQEEHGARAIREDDARCSDQHHVFRVTQHAAEFFARRYGQLTGMTIVGTRPSVCHSPLKDVGISRWSNDFASKPARGQPMHFPFPREQRNSLVWVDDAADVYAALADHPAPKYDMYNSGGYNVSCGELADLVSTIVPGARFSFSEGGAQPMPADVDRSRANDDLGLRLQPLDETLREHIEIARRMAG